MNISKYVTARKGNNNENRTIDNIDSVWLCYSFVSDTFNGNETNTRAHIYTPSEESIVVN